MMHSLLQVPVKSAVFGRFCFARAYRDRSETYRQRNINSKHTVPRRRMAYHRFPKYNMYVNRNQLMCGDWGCSESDHGKTNKHPRLAGLEPTLPEVIR